MCNTHTPLLPLPILLIHNSDREACMFEKYEVFEQFGYMYIVGKFENIKICNI
jgi:hypothetical protein